MEHILRWLRKELIRNKRQRYDSEEEGMRELIEVLKKPKSPPKDAWALAFIMSDQNQDLFTHVKMKPGFRNFKKSSLFQ